MSLYIYRINESIMEYDDDFYKVIKISVIIDNGVVPIKSKPFTLDVMNGNTFVQSFSTLTTGDQKGFIGFFSNDAFDSLVGLSEIHFGYAGEPQEVISGVDIADEIIPRSPDENTITSLEATTAWLVSIL